MMPGRGSWEPGGARRRRRRRNPTGTRLNLTIDGSPLNVSSSP